jgi:hypothetical protein
MYASPLAACKTVVRSRSVASLPIALSAGMLLCSFSWTLYGGYIWDVAILVPNVLGVVVSCIQICLYLYFAGTPESKAAAAAAAAASRAAVAGPLVSVRVRVCEERVGLTSDDANANAQTFVEIELETPPAASASANAPFGSAQEPLPPKQA